MDVPSLFDGSFNPLYAMVEGFFFSLGWYPAYHFLDWVVWKIPQIKRKRVSQAAKVLNTQRSRSTVRTSSFDPDNTGANPVSASTSTQVSSSS